VRQTVLRIYQHQRQCVTTKLLRTAAATGNKRKHFVFLTPLGSDPADEGNRRIYINYSYQQIASSEVSPVDD
jgi:hypothetical protein